jgi:hypothetical protein
MSGEERTCPGTVPREVVEEVMEGVGMVTRVAEEDMGVVQEATKVAEMVVVEEVAFDVEKKVMCPGTVLRKDVEEAMEGVGMCMRVAEVWLEKPV